MSGSTFAESVPADSAAVEAAEAAALDDERYPRDARDGRVDYDPDEPTAGRLIHPDEPGAVVHGDGTVTLADPGPDDEPAEEPALNVFGQPVPGAVKAVLDGATKAALTDRSGTADRTAALPHGTGNVVPPRYGR